SATAHISCISPFSSLLAPRHLSHFCIFSLTSPSDIYTLSLHDALPICQVINQDPYHYYTITESAEQELIKATNELHLMYLHATRSEEHTSELQSRFDLVCRLLLEKKKTRHSQSIILHYLSKLTYVQTTS